ncbi:MAG: 30S ribosomal protein S16 [Leptospiraceae bacterium]|nr:30S ribosomal protein S16 [Leptospiraceae bacterium]MDW8306577.1 30S ribosomal protein S16 [Leptospiraceae bacterium]
MQVKLRLQRFGNKKRPYYRIVAAGSEKRRDGQFLDILGIYHPLAKEHEESYRINREKVEMWLNRGAKPTETVRSLLSKAGIWQQYQEEKERIKREKKLREKSKEKNKVEQG